MRDTVTISLPPEIKKQLDKVAKKEQVNRSDIIREALRRYLFRTELEAIRRKMVPKAQSMEIYTDEDIFKIVS